ncbi:hypothetical protein GCM10009853_100560 [Glycomyces scopariae]
MDAPSAPNWKQVGLVSAVVAATAIVLGFIAEAAGIIAIDLSPDETPRIDASGASPSDIFTAESTPEFSPDESSGGTAAEGRIWTAFYEDQTMYLDTFTASIGACTQPLRFDLDRVEEQGTITVASNDVPDAGIDLVWDPCTGHDVGEAYLISGENNFGSHWVAGSDLDAETCATDIDRFGLGLRWTIDVSNPAASFFTDGAELCLSTSSGQIVLATVEAPTYTEGYGLQAFLHVSSWTPQ